MPDEIPCTRMSIRDAGHDEYWLQSRIVAQPNCLTLGDLELVTRERQQASGGRLDLLLKDPEDDTMYEVEIMLGATDESHVIRTIEYWDNERHKWPKRQHIAVLVAEDITSRFYNVIHLLSQALPLIAVQVNLIGTASGPHLNFTKILDTYEEPEEELDSREVHDETYWRDKASWTVEAAKKLLEVILPALPKATLKFLQRYIAVTIDGSNYLWLKRKKEDKSMLEFRVKDHLYDEMSALLDQHKISFTRAGQYFRFTVDKQLVTESAAALQSIAKLVEKSINA